MSTQREPLYDSIGTTYSRFRRPDPRVAAIINGALGNATSVLSIGSGTGSYEPRDLRTVALEPSRVMIDQRPDDAPPVVQGVAEHLPFADARFDAGLAVLTVHHWSDPVAGLRELTRVSERQVILTSDPSVFERYWLVADYIPEIPGAEVDVATLAAVVDALEVIEVLPVPVPWDCTDGFCCAYWRRPEIYLDPDVRAAISGFSRCDPSVVERAMGQLAGDLSSGRWQQRYGDLLELDEVDLGLRLVVAQGAR